MPLLLLLVVLVPTLGVALAIGTPRPVTQRRPAAWRWGGLAVGVVAAWGVDRVSDLGRGTMLAVPLVALGLLAGVLVGETRGLAPAQGTRHASLQVRRVADHLPRVLTAAVAAGLTGLLGLLAAGIALGSPDDLGRAGRSLAISCGNGFGQARGPWPGSFYAVPLAAVLLGGAVASALAARAVVRRPLRLGADADLAAETQARRSSVADVVAALGVLVAVPLGGVAVTTAGALNGIDCRPGSWTALLLVATVLALAALALLVASAATLLRPAPARDRVRSDQ
ncbi:hypothetical protein [Nocardioides marmoribigeumensis]|uniref:ABC transporter permease n=1 Tax=Nocardioides marmoribigeumensis TaxID=433649 RepID=A0ABU2BVJ9_9ACTN|nr:hypothetical protein [Nocardioides marmoribigeumensis]MDR7362658.1 hypothetical protein [Nocardioides marmoribigeumensis]